MIRTKPDIKKEHEQDIKMMKTELSIKFKKEEMLKTEPDIHEEEKAALMNPMTTVFVCVIPPILMQELAVVTI